MNVCEHGVEHTQGRCAGCNPIADRYLNWLFDHHYLRPAGWFDSMDESGNTVDVQMAHVEWPR